MEPMKPVNENDPCGLTWGELAAACRNVGVDLECGQCAAVFFAGAGTYPHTCGAPSVLPVQTYGEELAKFHVGDRLVYTRVAGEEVTGQVYAVYDWEEHPADRPPWPKPRHCRYLYRMTVPHGIRTVCECRLSRAEEP